MHNSTNTFNRNNRTSNSIKSSLWGAVNSAFGIVFGFVYRTVFIAILRAEYLGLNGLFSNILQVLSLAELGITTAIVYRFYEPISKNDYVQVGRLMNYLKIIYRYIAIIIVVVGLSITPFIKYFINDMSSIPNDINIYFIYVLFLLNTVSSYLFAYKQNILSADQRGYIISIVNIISSLVKYIIQILVLIVSGNYTFTLFSGIVLTILINILFSYLIQKKYASIFEIKDKILVEDKKAILTDTKAFMFHRVGATVKLSTDSIIITKFVSLVSAGIYSNYSMIITGIQSLISQLLGNFVSSVGNAHFKLSSKENYSIYRKLLFTDLWISTVTIVCTYLLLNDFIDMWIGEKYLFDKATLIMLCLQFYIFISRQINISYIYGCGLFTRDKYRPIIEAVLNLVLSIIGVKTCGIVGVFIGTVVSSVLTVCWREPVILFNEEFKEPVYKYWKTYLSFVFISLVICFIGDMIKQKFITISSWFILIAEAIVIFAVVNIVLFLIYRKSEEYAYMKQLIKKVMMKRFNKS